MKRRSLLGGSLGLAHGRAGETKLGWRTKLASDWRHWAGGTHPDNCTGIHILKYEFRTGRIRELRAPTTESVIPR